MLEAGERRFLEAAAARNEAPGERFDIVAGPVDHAVTRLQRSDEPVAGPERRFEIADRVAFIFPPADAPVAADRPAIAVGLEGRPVPVGHEVGFFADTRLGRRAPRQRQMLLQAVAYNGRQGGGDPADMRVAAVAQIAGQPGQQGREIGPAQEQRAGAAQQHAGRFLQQAGHRDRHHGSRHQYAAVAVGRSLARRLPVRQGHAQAAALQVQRRADADDPGAEDKNLGVGSHDGAVPPADNPVKPVEADRFRPRRDARCVCGRRVANAPSIRFVKRVSASIGTASAAAGARFGKPVPQGRV